MPKVRRGPSPSIDCSRSRPYHSSSKNVELHKSMNLLGSVSEMKEWDDTKCPICMESPHNGVLLKCSSYEMGCRPYMCNTSYRHSNCLDQYCMSYTSHLSSAILEEITLASTSSDDKVVQSESGHPSQYRSQLQPMLICPLCRGGIYGYMVLEPARSYMNSKPRSCSSETCEFQGTYRELRKHARLEHPSVRPSEVDPSRQCDWSRMERERELEDLFSTINASSGVENQWDIVWPGSSANVMQRMEQRMEREWELEYLYSNLVESFTAVNRWDTVWPGSFADVMSVFLFEILSSIEEDANRMASSRPRMPSHDGRSGRTLRVSIDDTQTNQSARWRSSIPPAHQLERINRGRWRTNSSQDLETNHTARWRTNPPLSRMPRNARQYYRELSPGVRTSSTRMHGSSQVTQMSPRSDISSTRRTPPVHQLHWGDHGWSTYNNQP